MRAVFSAVVLLASGLRRTLSNRAIGFLLAAILASASLAAAGARASTFTFQGLGDLPGEPFYSEAFSVSANGEVVVGRGSRGHGFRWTSPGGMVAIGGASTSGNDISADGSVIVGGRINEAYRWTIGGGIVGLGVLPGKRFSQAGGVSADGSVVVGLSSNTSGFEAFRWTDSGMVGLGDFVGGAFGSLANAVSGDGSVIVGYGTSDEGIEAYRWTSGGGMVGLGDLPGGGFLSSASDVSADGSVVVGRGRSDLGDEAYRWTSGGGMVGLGDLPGGDYFSIARAVSGDGSVVVGLGNSAVGEEAFLWTSGGRMQNLRDLLVAGGATGLASWTLHRATGVSADGRTIVGRGTNPQGQQEAWIATIPEPSTVVLAAMALVGLLAFGWRRRRARQLVH